ncbi:MAG: glucuronate isomerase [Balneolaceae bacterium]|nr:MAG: glucuronate isomerase [Balneolaceae bacterium]
MKKPFIHDDFMLQNDMASQLFHQFSEDQPIIDYHCHLPPGEIAADINYRNLTHIWLEGDHYKWRAMRTCGVDEKYITGNASDKEKFMAWAQTVPKTLRNPLYHWTHMELKHPFGITDRLLNGETAESVWNECNEMLKDPGFSARKLLERSKVKVVGTTDDPTDSLEHHASFRNEKGTGFIMVPTFRPDAGMEIENVDEFRLWVQKLEKAADIEISTYNHFLEALEKRHNYFDSLGCRASDHGVDQPYSDPYTEQEIQYIFDKVMIGGVPGEADARKFKSAFLYKCGLMDYEKGWVFQLHIGAMRNNNTRMKNKLGANTGFDSMGDLNMARQLSRLLDRLDTDNRLPKVVLYNNNPRDNELFATMIGNFQDGSMPGKLQYGPPWWFLDQIDGIEKQVEALSNMGILSLFIGMTTDSRSFLSFPRHDYFRRIVCNIIGRDIEKGLIPDDIHLVSELVRNISYQNAKNYFEFDIT